MESKHGTCFKKKTYSGCDSVDDEITSMIEYLKYIVYMIHNLSLKNDKKELELFCKKNESMIQFLCKSSNDSNVEKKIGFEKIVEKYINI